MNVDLMAAIGGGLCLGVLVVYGILVQDFRTYQATVDRNNAHLRKQSEKVAATAHACVGRCYLRFEEPSVPVEKT